MRGFKTDAVLLRSAAGLAAGVLACLAPAALGDDASGVGSGLEARYPGVRTLVHGTGRAEMFYGVPMTTGATAEAAAMAFLAQHGSEFGVGQLELDLAHQTTVRDGRFTAFLLNQRVDGIPVHLGIGRVLVLDRGHDHAVVYAAGKFARNDAGDLNDLVFVGAEQALAAVRGDVRLTNFEVLGAPELVAWFNGGDGAESAATRPAWRVVTQHSAFPQVGLAYEVFVDAQTGQTLRMDSLVHQVDVEGTVSGLASPGTRPDIASNPPVSRRLPLLQVVLAGGSSAVTDLNGQFVIPHGGTSPVTINAGLSGPWVRIVNAAAGGELTASAMVTPPGPADLLFNPTPSEKTTSQVNTLLHTNLTYDYIKSRAPGFTGLDRQTQANVNVNDNCNAFFSGADLSINFFTSGGGCVNTAYSTVVAHEYGHFIVNRLGLQQGAFGEGYSDSVAVKLYDTGVVGEAFFGSGSIRNPEAAAQQYPCTSGAIHTCGQIIGGSWRWIRLNLSGTLGSGPALDEARDLHVAWSMIATGGRGLDSAGPWTAIEVLTVDDDDGTIGNGTPNFNEICAAFDRHGIDCPELDLLSISVLEAPETLLPSQSGDVRVRIDEVTAGMVDGSARLGLIIDGATTLVPLAVDGDTFVATIPGQPGLTDLAFFVSAQADTGDTVRIPATGGFPVLVGVEVVNLDFETADGWTVENFEIDDGAWNRGVPANWGRGDPSADFDGSGQCFLTDNDTTQSNSDVDGGPTTLVSPIYDLSDSADAIVSYARWFTNDDRDVDTLRVQVSNNGGTTWTTVETLGHFEGWVKTSWKVADFLPLTSEMRFRFQATDNPNDSVTEAGIDAFRIVVDGETTCRADIDGDGELTLFDFLAFQNAFASGDPVADFDDDGELTLFDFLAFQNAFALGCP